MVADEMGQRSNQYRTALPSSSKSWHSLWCESISVQQCENGLIQPPYNFLPTVIKAPFPASSYSDLAFPIQKTELGVGKEKEKKQNSKLWRKKKELFTQNAASGDRKTEENNDLVTSVNCWLWLSLSVLSAGSQPSRLRTSSPNQYGLETEQDSISKKISFLTRVRHVLFDYNHRGNKLSDLTCSKSQIPTHLCLPEQRPSHPLTNRWLPEDPRQGPSSHMQ
ncbi:hypothetical protein AAY473_000975 [Plecturocebus cupreus]